MLYDVSVEFFERGTRATRRDVMTCEATGGDDAVAQAMVWAQGKANTAEGYKIVCVTASEAVPVAAPVAAIEGEDAPADEGDERAQLIQRAMDEGVTVDRRWGVARLRQALGISA